MRYTVITRTAIFETDWLLFPDWAHVIYIVDNREDKYTKRDFWQSDQDKPTWLPILKDNL